MCVCVCALDMELVLENVKEGNEDGILSSLVSFNEQVYAVNHTQQISLQKVSVFEVFVLGWVNREESTVLYRSIL